MFEIFNIKVYLLSLVIKVKTAHYEEIRGDFYFANLKVKTGCHSGHGVLTPPPRPYVIVYNTNTLAGKGSSRATRRDRHDVIAATHTYPGGSANQLASGANPHTHTHL